MSFKIFSNETMKKLNELCEQDRVFYEHWLIDKKIPFKEWDKYTFHPLPKYGIDFCEVKEIDKIEFIIRNLEEAREYITCALANVCESDNYAIKLPAEFLKHLLFVCRNLSVADKKIITLIDMYKCVGDEDAKKD